MCAFSIPTTGSHRRPTASSLPLRDRPAPMSSSPGYEDHDDATGVRHVNDWVDCDDFIAQQLGEVWSSHYSAFLFRRELVRDIPHRQDFALRDDRLFILEVSMRKPRLAVYRQPGFVHRRHGSERLQHTAGFKRDVGYWTYISIFRKVLAMLEAQGELTLRRKRAAIGVMWPNVRSFAKAYPTEAAEIVDWIYRLDPDFKPPVRPVLTLAYKVLGFCDDREAAALSSALAMTSAGAPAGGRPLRIVHCVGFYVPDSTGGTEVYVRDLVTALSRHSIDGTIIAATNKGYDRYKWHGVDVVRYPINATDVPSAPTPGRGSQARRSAFQGIVEEAEPDIFHLHSWTSGAKALAICGKWRGWAFHRW